MKYSKGYTLLSEFGDIGQAITSYYSKIMHEIANSFHNIKASIAKNIPLKGERQKRKPYVTSTPKKS